MVLIGGGVFLGLVGEQWRQNAQNRDVAEASLRRIRAEIVTNRSAVAAVADYHATTLKTLQAYLAVPVGKRRPADLHIQGIRSVFFEHTAWDLALVTQSLAHIDPELAFALSRVYNVQETYERLTSGITQAMYLQNPTDNLDAFAGSVAVYYGDISMMEPTLLETYDQLIRSIDDALSK